VTTLDMGPIIEQHNEIARELVRKA
jgi:hypothetical protein